MDNEGLLQIGVFSRLARTSVRMLRHYDEHGLLPPAWVDSRSGYRYYGPDQLAIVEKIGNLRDAGFTVAEMAEVLQFFDDPSRLAEHLQAQRLRLAKELVLAGGRVAALERLIHRLKEPQMSIEAGITTVPAMTVATLRDVIDSYASEGVLWQRLMPQLIAAQVPFGGISGATFHDEEYTESAVDVEIWQQVPQAFQATAPVRCQQVPAQQAVSATLLGSYDQMHQVNAALCAYVAEHGLTTGPMFNIYRVSPAQDPDPANWVTEVCLPIIEE
jgi:DNA-binding transcriptional MerR regulator